LGGIKPNLFGFLTDLAGGKPQKQDLQYLKRPGNTNMVLYTFLLSDLEYQYSYSQHITPSWCEQAPDSVAVDIVSSQHWAPTRLLVAQVYIFINITETSQNAKSRINVLFIAW
jgi:hypothetical protein